MSKYTRSAAFFLRLAGICMVFGAILFLFAFNGEFGFYPFAQPFVIGNILFSFFLFAYILFGFILLIVGKRGQAFYSFCHVVLTIVFLILFGVYLLTEQKEFLPFLPAFISGVLPLVIWIVGNRRKRSWALLLLISIMAHFFALIFFLLKAGYSFSPSLWALLSSLFLGGLLAGAFSVDYLPASYGRKTIGKIEKPSAPAKYWKENGMLFSNKEY